MGKALIAMAAACGLVMALILFAVIGSEEPPACGPTSSGSQVDVRALTYPSSTGALCQRTCTSPRVRGPGPPRRARCW